MGFTQSFEGLGHLRIRLVNMPERKEVHTFHSSGDVDVTIEYSPRRHLLEIPNSELEGQVISLQALPTLPPASTFFDLFCSVPPLSDSGDSQSSDAL